jgi:hypothetical protein
MCVLLEKEVSFSHALILLVGACLQTQNWPLSPATCNEHHLLPSGPNMHMNLCTVGCLIMFPFNRLSTSERARCAQLEAGF